MAVINNTTPEEGRELWEKLLQAAKTGTPAGVALGHILESVVIDLICNKIAHDDEFAGVIGGRIQTILPAVEEYFERQEP